ncbi:MAG TPA: hypothetical protein PLP75_08195 [Burkholderiales bacterium]|jgi:hypothetical protein|nr:hypothetical protein [Burkholderiales bacterium]
MKLNLPIWHRSNGEIVSCTEKVKVMRENIEELQQVIQDAYEDALLMDVDSAQIKSFLITMIENLENPYKDSNV